MKISFPLTKISLLLFYGILVAGLSCIKDHDLPPANLPESACTTTNGTPRLYPCEFMIEKMIFLGKDGVVVAEATKASTGVSLSRANAKFDSKSGINTDGTIGYITYDAKMVLKRIARPSFPVTAGYVISATTNSSKQNIIHTPGERDNIGSPIALDMVVGETREVNFEIAVKYKLSDMTGTVIPIDPGFNFKAFFIENDNTTLQFNRNVDPYRYVGSVVEDYIRLEVRPAL